MNQTSKMEALLEALCRAQFDVGNRRARGAGRQERIAQDQAASALAAVRAEFQRLESINADLADAGASALGWLREAFGHASAPYNESAHRCINALSAALAKAGRTDGDPTR